MLMTISRKGKRRIRPLSVTCLPGSDNFSADGKVYYRISEARVELYTDVKALASEQKIEDALDAAGIFYNKTENLD